MPDGFSALPYVNPDAPKGGRVVYGIQGSFDSVNPFIVKGAPAAGVNTLVFDTLMRRSANEPFTYLSAGRGDDRDAGRPILGRVPASIRGPVSPTASRSQPRMSRSRSISCADHGRPNTRASYAKVTKVEVKDEQTIRFELGAGADREMPLILATMVVLPKHAIDPATFEQSTLKPMIGSGPYVFGEIRAGQSVAFKRNPDWWARDLPSNRGLYNFDEVRYDYYRDASSMFEAFKSGLYDVRPEGDAGRWATQYVFPALRDGRVVKEEIPNGLPKGMNAFVFNTRRPIFQDARLREALGLLFDFEWANKNLFYGLYVRSCSFFEGSELSSCGRPADQRERQLLAAFAGAVSEDVLEGRWAPPRSDGSGRDRAGRSQGCRDAQGRRVGGQGRDHAPGLHRNAPRLPDSRPEQRAGTARGQLCRKPQAAWHRGRCAPHRRCAVP